MCVWFAIVSMVGTNFHDSKLIKGDSVPGPNEIGPGARVRSGRIGPRPIFFHFFFLFLIFFLFFFFRQLLRLVASRHLEKLMTRNVEIGLALGLK